MSLLVLGINHKTAPVELREKVAFSPQQLEQALGQLSEHPQVRSCVIVSTCNRTEIYAELNQPGVGVLVEWLTRFHQLSSDSLMASIYYHEEQSAVKHLMRVACGLDSLVLGEPQILGQVKQAYASAGKAGMISGSLEKLFHKTFAVAKRIRTETEIGGNAVSVAFAACTLARQIFESLSDVTTLLVGAGETIELVARHLKEHQCSQIIFANRTQSRAQALAEQFDAKMSGLEALPEQLCQADIVISSTAAPMPLIEKAMVEKALKQRRHQPMLLIDIAVPRDIDENVGSLADAYLYSVDDLQSIVEHNREQRKLAAIQAEAIVTEESADFMRWLRSREAVDSIKQYRTQSEHIKQAELEQSIQALANGADAESVLRQLSNRLTNKLIHPPTQAMQQAAQNGEPDKLAVMRVCLGLDSDN
ncbi:glutamyl-tRNA reductase [Salinivibrio kushneri]|uniref:Glutamyl-tRNA reductase n=1 Tax=Salinivibrio kushneri TaxID=1908198 RepID=A0AB36JZE9_9GAMM|nr:glutamyl-tRNA reductase [Salinivibrio kushneri]OOE41017.1 glutamyl-tRNA reductase [Salinivibrio kushneri]QCP01620.1 glutamyl-tRNA reductase [Salinivibrio kushneri]